MLISEFEEAQVAVPDNAFQSTNFKKSSNEKYQNCVIEIFLRGRRYLLGCGRVYLGWTSCKVKDFVRVTRCYVCRRYGHTSKFCKSQKT